MNFNVFVLVATAILFAILRIHKKRVENGERLSIIYLLYTPLILYATKYYFNCNNISNNVLQMTKPLGSNASSSISSIYPLSS